MSLILLKYTLNVQSCVPLNQISQIKISILSINESSENLYSNISKEHSKFLNLPFLFDDIIPLKMFKLFKNFSFFSECNIISY